MAWINSYSGTSTINVDNTNRGSTAMFHLKELLKEAGWTVKSSSDGSTYNASGDQITGEGSGANGMDNNYAWFRIQDPGVLREYVFQRGTISYSWKWLYSASDKFTGGSPDATTIPTATDQQGLARNATSFQTMFQTNNEDRFHMAAQNTAHNGVYSWWLIEIIKRTGLASSYQTGMWCEAMDATYPSNDNDPCVHYGSDDGVLGSNIYSITPTGTDHFKCWMRYGETNEEWGGISGAFLSLSGYALAPSNGFIDAFSGKYTLVSPVWFRPTAAGSLVGFKGVGKYLKFRPNVAFHWPIQLTDGTENYITVADMCYPGFPSGVVPIL